MNDEEDEFHFIIYVNTSVFKFILLMQTDREKQLKNLVVCFNKAFNFHNILTCTKFFSPFINT
jgi:hypothetical protein